MMAILMVIQVFVAIALIGVVLIQRSEGGGLGIGSSQGMGAFMSGRGTANLLTRATAILATVFLGLSLAMAVLNRGGSSAGSGILSGPPAAQAPAAPVSRTQTHAATSAPASAAAPAPVSHSASAPASGPAPVSHPASAPASGPAPVSHPASAPASTPAPAAGTSSSTAPAPSGPVVPH